jgi:Uma2 family endonuclease
VTALHPPVEPKLGSQRFVLHDVNWRIYRALADALGDRPIRLAYDRGSLEVRTLSFGHEWWKRRFGLLIDSVAVELGMDIQGGGSTTFQREDVDRGIEADECYYVANELKIRGKKEIDLSRDPPPDLAIEIEITHSALNRMGIYATFGVPELWRFDGTALHVFQLSGSREYEACDRSLCFPTLPTGEVVAFIDQTSQMSESAFVRALRDWIRKRVPSNQKNGSGTDA